MASTSAELTATHNKFDYRETDDPQVIKAQIESTRAEMSKTIDAIQYKLSPTHLAEETKKNLKGKVEEMAYQASDTAGNWRSNLVNTMRENPIPAAMIGIGLGWLFFNKSTDDDEYYYPTYQEVGNEEHGTRYFDRAHSLEEAGYRDDYSRTSQIKEGVREKANQATSKAASAAGTVQDKASETVDQVKESVGQTASAVGDKVSSAHEATMGHSSRLAQKARDNSYYYGRQAKRTSKDMFYENPLAAGAVALAAGALVGLLVPTTQKEHEMMGETRDQMLEQAKDKVMDTVDRVQNVAGEVQQTAVETAKHEADKQGLTN